MNTDYETMVEPLTEEERKKYASTGNEAAVYVGTYHKYVSGSLDGMWVNLEMFSDSEELYDFLHRLHADEDDPEFMFQDYENFPSKFYKESGCDFDGLYDWLAMDEGDKKIVAEYWDEIDEDRDAQSILDAFIYEGNAEEYYDELADEMLSQSDCPDSIRPYFDYKMWERDCSYDYNETNHYLFSAY